MAENLQFQINYAGGSYVDASVSVTSISELVDKFDFIGQSVHMTEAFVGVNEVPYPVDFWMIPNGEDVKWCIKFMPSIESEGDLEKFKSFSEEFKTILGYYPMTIGFEFFVNGEKYVFGNDENGVATYTTSQTTIDEYIDDTVALAVDEAVNKVTSGASEAFDTLKEIEDWISANSGNTPDLSDYATKEEVANAVDGLASETYVNEQIAAIEFPETDLTGYATEAWVEEKNYLTEHQSLEGYAKVEDIPSVEGLASEQFVTEKIAEVEIPSLDGYATEAWVKEQNYLTEHQSLEGLATEEFVAEKIAEIEIPSVEGLASEAWVKEQNYLTEHQSLEGYAKIEDLPSVEGLASEQFVAEKIAEIEIPSVEGLASEAWVEGKGYLTEHQSLEGLATEEFVTNQGYITEHQDISHLATKEEVNEIAKQIPSIDGLATETYVDEKVASINIPSIEGLATEAWVNEQGFLTEHQDLSEYAKKEELPTLEGYATESWVSAEIAKAQLEGEDVDLSGYATKDDIKDFATEQFVTDRISEIQIPSVEGLATEAWVNEQGFLTEHQDITGKQDVIEDLEAIREGAAKGATALQEVPEGYATETWVGEQGFLTEHQDITGKQDVIEDLEVIREGASKGATALQEVPEGYATEAWVGEQGFLTEHQDISGLATKEEVANAIAEIEIPSIEGLATEQFVTDEIAKIEIPSIDHLATKEELEIVSGSIKSVIEDLLIPENAKETLDTLEEISAWIQSHPDDAASMNAQIVALQESAHTHENKDVLDGITAEKVAAWDAAEANAKGYANDEIAKLSDVYAKKTDIEGLATETWVSAEIAKAQLEGEDIDLSGYATKDDIKDFATEQFVTDEIAKIEIPTLDGYATEAWVGEQGFLTEHQDITGKQDVIEDLEVIREGASKGATALQEVPEGYATEAWVGEQGFLTEHQDISGLATKEEVSEAVLSAQTYADSLVENLKPYDGGTAVDVVDYTVNVNVAEDGFLKVNEENELTVTGVTLDAAVTSKDITIEGGQWATAVKTVFTGGTVPAGTTWQSFLESMLCVEKFDTSYSMSKAFTVSCGTLGEGITGATNNSSVEVGTKVSLKSFEANPTTASQSYTVSTFDYGYKLGEDGTYNKGTSFKETLTPSLKASNDALTATFTTFVDESGNTIAKISGNTSMGEVKMRVMDGTNKVVIAQTGDTYTASSAVTAGTIYVATNLKNYYKSDKKTPNTYTPSYASEDKTATASTTYTVTGYRNTFYGTTSKTDAADATFIRTLTKSNKAIAAGNTISFDTNSSDGHLRMVIASPRTIKSVKNQTGTQDLTALLVGTKATVSVGGVDNFAPISYNVYDYTWKGAFGNETWIITFA